jgi:hypothetical protein
MFSGEFGFRTFQIVCQREKPETNHKSTIKCRVLANNCILSSFFIQGESQILVLILTSGRTHQCMKLFSITFCKICKSCQNFLPSIFTHYDSRRVYILMTNLFQILNQFVTLFLKKFKLKKISCNKLCYVLK